MAATGGILDSLRQPEYTGENRCVPCTVVNVVIGTLLSLALLGLGWWAAGPGPGLVLGGATFVLSLAAIYFRGYLVPGTPSLTKQYFPTWLHSAFGKGPTQHSGSLDPEAILVRANALEECAEGNDLCLTDSFREAWYREMDRTSDDAAGRERLLVLLELEEAAVEFEEFGDAFRARVNGTIAGKWESQAAFRADLGAARVLEDTYEGWEGHTIEEKSQLLNGLRLFIDNCPNCAGVPSFETETVESCCSTHEVAAVSCPDCDARLFETHV